MKTIEKHNAAVRELNQRMRERIKHQTVGVLCKCGVEMVHTDGVLMIAGDNFYRVRCPACGYTADMLQG